MELEEVLRRRRTVRHDSDEPLAPQAVEAGDAGLRPPSPGSSPGRRLPVLTDLAPQDATSIEARRPRVPDVVHGSRW